MKPDDTDTQDPAKDVYGCTMGHELFGGPGSHIAECEPATPPTEAERQVTRNEYVAEMEKHYAQVRKDKADYSKKQAGKL